ncbi:MAG: glucose-6-phosphate 1-dehydrogenase [Actinomycetota bacterium]|jgi:glucose-6-phosphate 1-dehydrogenase|nr:glucose-6-phosphate 1-dehydrogenase [Actinomycetota bacterium]
MSSPRRTLVILGASGDLTARLLLPGLGQLISKRPDLDLELIGVGTMPMTPAQWHKRVAASFAAGGADATAVSAVIAASTYRVADATSAVDLAKILADCTGTPALYFALPPAVTEKVVEALAKMKLPTGIVLALEKPFGTDLRSAKALNRVLATFLPEHQVHRVDHFLGKSTVLNILGLRFANRLFEESWNASNIARIEINYDEQIGLEARAGYYDHAGALIDMIQSHLLQVLAVVAMEPPSTLDSDDLRGAMAQVLRATRIWKDNAKTGSRRARYTAGTVAGQRLGSYVKQPGVDPARSTETLAEMVFSVDNWRWAGVPFVLRSGKALSDNRKDIVITFREVPHLPTGIRGHSEPSQLRISLDPHLMELDLSINGEGNPFTLDPVTLSATFADSDLPAYGEVLEGILTGDAILSVRGDVAEECWRIVSPVISAWRKNAVPIDNYPAGSSGPKSWKAFPRT